MQTIGIRKIYLKQAVQMLKQNKFMSIIAIAGTALAIMMIMTIIVSEEVKNVNVAPEINRYRTYYLDGYTERDTVTNYASSNGGNIPYHIIHDCLKALETPELVSVYSSFNRQMNVTLGTSGKKESFTVNNVKETDAAYWQLFSFSFLKGRAYTQEEFESGMPCAVVGESEARMLFRGEEALGKTFELYKKEYRVVGVVKDVSPVFRQANAGMWIPYTSVAGYEQSAYLVALLAKMTGDYPALSAEIRAMEKRYEADHQPKSVYIRGPHNHKTFVLGIRGNSEEDIKENIQVKHRKRWVILAILLLVPALNLSGVSLSRIRKRTAEIGVRKAFGAKKYVILMQVLYENLITSLIGGALGLMLSYAIVFLMRNWLLELPDDANIPVAALVSPTVFIAVFLVCLLINLLSAGLPAYRASRVSIINSINQNEK
jgi:putative ABC transport system permease protein